MQVRKQQLELDELLCSPPGDPPNPGIEPESPKSPALAVFHQHHLGRPFHSPSSHQMEPYHF